MQSHGHTPNATPCSTLFVANLGAMTSEEEVREMFRTFPGFCRMRMHNKNGSPVAFIEYQVVLLVKEIDKKYYSQDVRSASQAMNCLQGTHPISSDRGGIRIEFAKQKMGDLNVSVIGKI